MTDHTDIHRFPCKTCGSDLRFAPDAQHLQCDHCGATEEIAGAGPWTGKSAFKELDYIKAIREGMAEFETETLRTFACKNCGAHIEFQTGSHAAECPYCATPHVGETGEERLLKPRAIAPFDLDERRAREAMSDWLGGLWFAPNGLAEYARKGRKLSGIYMPFWTYDANSDTRYRGRRGTIYYETRRVAVVVNGKRQMQNQQVQKIRWRNVSGRVTRFFDDILVLASKALPKSYTDALAPWDLTRLRPYAPEYIAGLRSEGYTIPLDQGFSEARQIIERTVRRDIRFDIGGDRQEITAMDLKLEMLTFKHILLPVWTAAYKYRGKSYRFVVNGQTGAVKGERPYSVWKILFAVVIALNIIALLMFLASSPEMSEIMRGF